MKWILVLVMGLGMIGFMGCGGASPDTTAEADSRDAQVANENLSTPEKTLEALKVADSSREYAEFCACFTEGAQRTLAGGLLQAGRNLKRFVENPDNQNLLSEDDKALALAIDNLSKKHGVERDLDIHVAPSADQEKAVVQTKGEEALTEHEVLQKMGGNLSDPCLFVADFIKTMRTHGRNPEARIIEDDARLEKLTITEETAEGELVFTREGQEVRRPIGFQKVSGEWHISQVPDVFFK